MAVGMRVGYGFDVHRHGGAAPLVLGGVLVEGAPGVEATSDGDIVVHALIDALLGAAALGDIGTMFPSNDSQWEGADSMGVLLPACLAAVSEAGWSVSNIDCTVIAHTVRVGGVREKMRIRLADALGTDVGAVSVKATTTDGLGAIGRGEGIAAAAVVVLIPAEG